ncbi:putative lipoprotein receptor 1-like [Homarus americanus]|uniref:Putative lipoprotein receptor 1-like n=1 Tax=Homarus americanus TaxID=6706 RepID=A0A8J5MNN5_HOMAM|nr:putative lipoprotein receptor 1-like [Homarus americanus]
MEVSAKKIMGVAGSECKIYFFAVGIHDLPLLHKRSVHSMNFDNPTKKTTTEDGFHLAGQQRANCQRGSAQPQFQHRQYGVMSPEDIYDVRAGKEKLNELRLREESGACVAGNNKALLKCSLKKAVIQTVDEAVTTGANNIPGASHKWQQQLRMRAVDGSLPWLIAISVKRDIIIRTWNLFFGMNISHCATAFTIHNSVKIIGISSSQTPASHNSSVGKFSAGTGANLDLTPDA